MSRTPSPSPSPSLSTCEALDLTPFDRQLLTKIFHHLGQKTFIIPTEDLEKMIGGSPSQAALRWWTLRRKIFGKDFKARLMMGRLGWEVDEFDDVEFDDVEFDDVEFDDVERDDMERDDGKRDGAEVKAEMRETRTAREEREKELQCEVEELIEKETRRRKLEDAQRVRRHQKWLLQQKYSKDP